MRIVLARVLGMKAKKHFVIATLGTSGDIFPFIEIGKYLLSRNHNVTFITNPYFEKVVSGNGLAFTPFGTVEQYLDLLNDPELWNLRTGFRVMWTKTIRPNLHCIRSCIQPLDSDSETVVLSHPAVMALANLARADRNNLKIVLVYLYPLIIRSYFRKLALGGVMTVPLYAPKFLKKMLFSLADSVFDAGIVPDLNEERSKLGLAPIQHFFPHLQNSADLYVTLYPEWYSPATPDYPQPFVSGDFVFNGSSHDVLSDELTAFLNAGQPPLLFTPGTGNLHARKFFEVATDVVSKLNARAVFLTRFREQLPPTLPDSVLWQEFVPLSRVLPCVSVIVHHGGMGTLAEASRAGVPQLTVPSAYDQFENALILKDLGIGESIPMWRLTRRNLLDKLSQIQRSEIIRQSCLNISSKFSLHLEINQVVEKVLSAI